MDDSHFNKNLPCTIAIKVTSDNPDNAEIVALTIVPLCKNFTPSEERMPFTIVIKPDSEELTSNPYRRDRYDYPTYIMARPQEMKLAIDSGMDYDTAMKQFERWFSSLRLGEHKKILPVSYGWAYTSVFLMRWFGYYTFEDYFDWHYRDPLSLISYDLDKSYLRNEAHPWRKLDFTSVLTCAGVDKTESLDTMSQCIDMSNLYQKLLTKL